MAVPLIVAGAAAVLRIGNKVYKSVKSYNKAKKKAVEAKKKHDAFVKKNVEAQKKFEELSIKSTKK